MKRLSVPSSFAAVLGLLLAFGPPRALAQLLTWDPQGANPQNPYLGSLSGTWESSSWDTTDQTGTASPAAWVEGSTALFAVNTGTGTPAFLVTLNANHTVAGIEDGGQTPGPCTVTLNGSGTITLPAGNQYFNITSPGALTISNVITGTGGLFQSDTGTLTLAGVNTYTGDTFIIGGLTITGAGKLGNGSYAGAIGDYGTFTYKSTAAQSLSGIISGPGSLAVAGTGVLTLKNSETYSGDTTIGSGSTLTLANGGKLNGGGNIINNGTLNYNTTASATLSGTISGSGALSVNPSGSLGNILTLSGANTYTGPTTVALAGQVVISSDSNLGTPPANFTANQLVLNYGFLKASSTFTLHANRGITLGTGVSGIGGSIQVNPGQTLTLAAPITGPSGFISGSGEVTFGFGTNVMAAHSTYRGPTVISTGRLMLGIDGALPYGTALLISADNSGAGVPGSIFDLNGHSQTIGTLTSTNTIYPPAGTGNADPTILLSGALTVLQTNVTTIFSGLITGPGSLTLNGNASGKLILSNYANAYTGGTFINSGTLEVSTGVSSLAGDVTLSGGALNLGNNAALASTATLTVGGSATVALNFSGTQTIAALKFGSTAQASGLWGAVGNAGATHTDSRFSGPGLLLVPGPAQATSLGYNAVNGVTINATGSIGAAWYLGASDDVTAPLPWPIIQSGTVTASPFSITDPDAVNHSKRFYYLTNSP